MSWWAWRSMTVRRGQHTAGHVLAFSRSAPQGGPPPSAESAFQRARGASPATGVSVERGEELQGPSAEVRLEARS